MQSLSFKNVHCDSGESTKTTMPIFWYNIAHYETCLEHTPGRMEAYSC
jgi:hypothetical protein